ncbi:exonuclease domain-containing protein [Streptomyces sp. P9(2023)]|uniref:exonuclease domain-containing protein n=1 Tax=Streptomyces sp. P9(2023) TaxID=3064394 RepID=UPI0028F410C6|nr:exonuclease domain-containing protein [Streptomyces sp. P9(2023)]MDT9688160.1 exonuclease domain-containing protein [Streptomyces sp. P9(2023)]
MSWHLGRMCGFDLETTGVDAENDRVVTACVVEVGGSLPPVTANWLANPGIDIPDAAAKVHGITTEQARTEGQPAAEAVEEITAALAQVILAGTPLVIMNASYDLTLLDREARRHGVQPLTDIVGTEFLVVDPRVIDKQISRRKGPRTLTDLCKHYAVKLDGAHSSDADAIAACRVAWRIANTTARIRETPLPQLHKQQVEWAAAQGRSLAAYFRRTPGKEHQADGVRTDWPFVPHQQNGASQ